MPSQPVLLRQKFVLALRSIPELVALLRDGSEDSVIEYIESERGDFHDTLKNMGAGRILVRWTGRGLQSRFPGVRAEMFTIIVRPFGEPGDILELMELGVPTFVGATGGNLRDQTLMAGYQPFNLLQMRLQSFTVGESVLFDFWEVTTYFESNRPA